jgi:integrase
VNVPGLPVSPQPNERYRPQQGMPPETVALLQQVLSGVAGLPIALQLLPFQFPSLQHLDERVARAIRRAEEVSGLSAKTTAAYRSAYRYFRAYLRSTDEERAFLGGQLLEQRRVLEGWIASLRAQGVTHTTVNTYWRGLHGAFVRIAREDNLTTPTQYVETPRPGKSLPRFLTRTALADVFRFVRNFQWPGGRFQHARNIALIAVMALGGCRRGEVLRMQVEDVDCAEGTIRIKRGKGPRGGKPRVICMPPALVAAMTTYMDLRSDRELATDRVFVSVGADTAIADTTIRRLCRLITTKTGIHVAPHLLRHTCATLMRQAGIADRLSMDQLGHSSLGVLQRYSHVAPGERQQAMAHFKFELGGGDTVDAELVTGRVREEHRLE